jgi:eukaryotic-like serine/threonine-protein kinase
MGEVYRATDTRLNRDVAIKVLPASFANDEDRLRRFEQEARATSALNHPNILTVYDIGTHEGAPYIIAELLEGEELRQQLNNGALPVRRCLEYAQQIAAGLAAAHEKGIVHRDLKPENLFVTKDGRVKILDFGLAKLRPPRSEPSGSEVATQKAITDPGTLMGTVGYMSPEQVRGAEADHRSDIFSFGVILYEMLTGRRAFQGGSFAETLSAILKEEPPDITEINNKVPPQLERIVCRCLEKKPERRFQTASDLAFAIEALSTPSNSRLERAAALPAKTESAGRHRLLSNARLAWIVAALLLLVSLPFVASHFLRAPAESPAAVRFTINAPEKVSRLLSPVLSPDGRNVAFAGVSDTTRLYLRPLGALTAQPLAGAEGVVGPQFWSPDSRSICFPAGDKLKRIDLAGGPPQTLCNLPGGFAAGEVGDGTWDREGTILFTAGNVIYRVSASGGEPTPVMTPDQSRQQIAHRWPNFLPDGRHFLFHVYSAQPDATGIYVASLDGKEKRRLLAADSQATYASPAAGGGYLLFVREGALLAQPFDVSSLTLTGDSVTVIDQVRRSPSGRGYFSVSENGVLIYAQSGGGEDQQLTWFDRAGKQLELVGALGNFRSPRLSPDEKRVAVARIDPKTRNGDIYVTDLARGGATSRLTFDAADDRSPVWSPDGSHVVWSSHRGGKYQLYQKLASGTGQDELLHESNNPISPEDWSKDGRFILYTENEPNTRGDVWVLPLDGERKSFPFLQTPYAEQSPRFSPDGRFVAYRSNETGRDEMYVLTFPAKDGKWQVSNDGAGGLPQWRGDGRELFYFSAADRKVMMVEIRGSSAFEPGIPKALFDLTAVRQVTGSGWAVTPDGQRFLFDSAMHETATQQYTVVVNWTSELKK